MADPSPFDSPISIEDLGAELPNKIQAAEEPEIEVPNGPWINRENLEATISRTDHIWGDWIARGYLTVVGGTTKTTKSTLLLTIAMMIAANRSDFGGPPKEPDVKVGFVSTEDSLALAGKTLLGIMVENDIQSEDIGNRMAFIGDDYFDEFGGFSLVFEGPDGVEINRQARKFLQDWVEQNEIGVLFIDPLFGATGAVELSPQVMNLIARNLKKLAQELDISVVLVHHTRKTAKGEAADDIEDLSGGKTLTNAARSVLMVRRMKKDEASTFSIGWPEEARNYVRVETKATNIGRVGLQFWYEIAEVMLWDKKGDYQHHTIKQWLPPNATVGIHPTIWNRLVDVIEDRFVYFGVHTKADNPNKLENVLAEIASELMVNHNTKDMAKRLREQLWLVPDEQVNPALDDRNPRKRAIVGDNPQGRAIDPEVM